MFSNIQALLIDLDGTLYFRGEQIPGANQAIRQLRDAGLKLRFLTNTDSIHAPAIHAKVRAMGIEVEPEEIFSPSVAVLTYFMQNPDKTCYCLVSSELDKVFTGLNWDYSHPDYVVIGDCRDKVSFEELNKVFRFIEQGAQILALSKSPYFYNSEGICLDTGSFVSLLEFASKKQAKVLGKPAPFFFDLVLNELQLPPSEVAVVGDDVNTDVLGAHNIGAKSVLLKTGKFTEETLVAAPHKPDVVIDSIADLTDFLCDKRYRT